MASMTVTDTVTENNRVLRDYRLYHSRRENNITEHVNGENTNLPRSAHPPGWDTTHRRVPPYRPADRERSQEEYNVYTSNVERAFITTMFTGVLINATMAKAWGASGGRINRSIFKYRVGGEA
ncbi:unnamed protein product [Clonostachys chloroleuca]|uniref:Uncharacterized protein n=1 Tax=Clonostachys chloroleuca TaxID=1926264 RepID=A0AA35MGX5_9HYPO|nr:unnamed protein product [Clonostachys chloroleuca]